MSKYLVKFWEDIPTLKEVEIEAESEDQARDLFYDDDTFVSLANIVEKYSTEISIDEIELIEE